MDRDDLRDEPVCIKVTMANDTNSHDIDLDTLTYMGVALALANRTIKVSAIVFEFLAADIMESIKFDGETITNFPFTQAVPIAGNYQTMNMTAYFGKPYVAVRKTITYEKDTSAGATSSIYFYGKATRIRSE